MRTTGIVLKGGGGVGYSSGDVSPDTVSFSGVLCRKWVYVNFSFMGVCVFFVLPYQRCLPNILFLPSPLGIIVFDRVMFSPVSYQAK